jgi:hypothetical protein
MVSNGREFFMKKCISIAVVFICVFPHLKAQEKANEKKPSFSIQGNLLISSIDLITIAYAEDFDLGFFEAEFEFQYAINNYLNISARPVFLMNFYEDEDEDRKQFLVSLAPGLLLNPFGRGLNGLLMGAFPVIGWGCIGPDYRDDGFTSLGFGFTLGYQRIARNGFTFSCGGSCSKSWMIPFEGSKEEIQVLKSPLIKMPFQLELFFRMGYSF